ncbi:DUF2800 domain-containing protein [Tissierella creatinophila]|uniref:PD-(D/E)XK nuclease superfamily protein n=1 Tax=Tissierella creatinophila DSM 6911 TaxID=1123403 RepID=A0A1U7M5X4_TISCR|nr:DUF2800 domain-containing protein [Tissierella creatinophila]OLS02588.1 PD-(D/E)XK nuclease superfamily protein [Tissierella creatinophila DSM 6911]
MAQHALLSASGADRWMNCPPSARLEENEEGKSSIFAREGTFAHDLSELKLRSHLGEILKADFNKKLKAMKENEFYTKELEMYVDQYVDFAIEKINEHKTGMISIEQRVDYSCICKEGFGTADLLVVDEDAIEVVDLKFGKGLRVDAIDNSQLRLYALGAVDNFNFLYGAKKVKMTIMQPRLDHISTDEMEVEDLLKWGEEEVKPKADLAYAGEGEFNPGEHCIWCLVKDRCRARADENMKLAKLDFKNAPLLTDLEVVTVLKQVDELVKWAKDIEKYAYTEAVNNNKEWPGFKLVEGRRTRKYTSKEEVAKVLLEAGYEEEKIYSKSLLSLTKLEKQLGKKDFEEVIGSLIERPPGKLKLVPDDDKRLEIKSSAEIDFKN